MKKTPSVLVAVVVAFALGDSTADAAQAAVRSNPVPNGSIVIDGSLADWAAVSAYPQDTIGDGSSGPARPLDIDILQGAIAHDANFFYFLYRNTGENMVDGFSNWVFIDLDQNNTTGFVVAGMGGVGAEYNLGGTAGWNQWNANGTHAGGAAGNTVAAGDSSVIPNGNDFLEWSISRTAVQPSGGTFNPLGAFNVVFGAEDTNLDTSPNNGGVDWFTYNVVPEPTGMLLGGCGLGVLAALRRRFA